MTDRVKIRTTTTTPKMSRCQTWSHIFFSSTLALFLLQEASCTEFMNVALNKTTSQSGTRHKGNAEKAVDGNRNSRFNDLSCTHTDNTDDTKEQWWLVDLGVSYQIQSVNITNRAEKPERLKDFSVYVSAEDPLPISSSSTSDDQLCFHHKGALRKGGPHKLSCDEPVVGRYLYIFKEDHGPLSLCEVEVMVKVPPTPLPHKLFHKHAGKRSAESPFFSTTLKVPSVLKCAAVCFGRREHEVQVVQFEESSRTCQCLEQDRLTSGTDYLSESGWTLMDAHY